MIFLGMFQGPHIPATPVIKSELYPVMQSITPTVLYVSWIAGSIDSSGDLDQVCAKIGNVFPVNCSMNRLFLPEHLLCHSRIIQENHANTPEENIIIMYRFRVALSFFYPQRAYEVRCSPLGY
jgi:hypothetical protein